MDHELSAEVVAGRGAERTRDLLWKICAVREVIRGAVSPDRVHMPVVAPPRLTPTKPVRFRKGRDISTPEMGAVDERW
jgi:hypothetical protein